MARFFRYLIFIQLGLAFAFFGLLFKFGQIASVWAALLAGFGLVLLLRLLATVRNFHLAARFHSEVPTAYRLNWRQKIGLFVGEFHAMMLTSSWNMHHHSFAKRLAADTKDYPVLLIHGYVCNSGYWHSLSQVLERERIGHAALDLEPVFGGIDAYVPLIERAITALCAETGSDKVIIVAHSMGGLAARAYLRDHGSARIARVITIGTPHHGTALANQGPGVNSRQMRWIGSAKDGAPGPWLQHLAAAESDATRALITSIYSYHDNIVAPQLSSQLPGADNIAFHGIGHVALAMHPQVQARVVEEIHRTRR